MARSERMPQMPASGGAGVYPLEKLRGSLLMAMKQPLLRTMGVLLAVMGDSGNPVGDKEGKVHQ